MQASFQKTFVFSVSAPSVRPAHRTSVMAAVLSDSCLRNARRFWWRHWRLNVLTVVVVGRRMWFRMIVSEMMMIVWTLVHVEVGVGDVVVCVVVGLARIRPVGYVTVCYT